MGYELLKTKITIAVTIFCQDEVSHLYKKEIKAKIHLYQFQVIVFSSLAEIFVEVMSFKINDIFN